MEDDKYYVLKQVGLVLTAALITWRVYAFIHDHYNNKYHNDKNKCTINNNIYNNIHQPALEQRLEPYKPSETKEKIELHEYECPQQIRPRCETTPMEELLLEQGAIIHYYYHKKNGKIIKKTFKRR